MDDGIALYLESTKTVRIRRSSLTPAKLGIFSPVNNYVSAGRIAPAPLLGQQT